MSNSNKIENKELVERSHNKKACRTADEKKILLDRLSRIEGQLRGIKSLVENDTYLIDLYMQVQAASAALNSLNKQILEEHLKKLNIESNINKDALDDAIFVIEKIIK